MKNWFAAANLMYRHEFVNSFASSASSGCNSMIESVSFPKRALAR